MYLYLLLVILCCKCMPNDIDQGIEISLDMVRPGLKEAIRSTVKEICFTKSYSSAITEIMSDLLEKQVITSYRPVLKEKLLNSIMSAPVNDNSSDYTRRLCSFSIKNALDIQMSLIDRTSKTWNGLAVQDYNELIPVKDSIIDPTLVNRITFFMAALTLAFPAYKLLNKPLFIMTYSLAVLIFHRIFFGKWIRPERGKRRISKRPVI